MLTHLSREKEVLALRGLEFERELDIPTRNFLPEGENCIPSVVQYQNNRLRL
jgi:hypothetical protein